jgi:hypothetical protein
MKNLHKPSILYSKPIAFIIKHLNIPMPTWFWAVFYSNDIDKELWDNIIIKKNVNEKISFKQIITECECDTIIDDTQEEYEEIYMKDCGKNGSNISIDVLKEKKEYLQSNFNLEKQRQSLLDNKLTQIIGQTSVVVAVIALIIPLLIDKISLKNDITTLTFWVFLFSSIFTLVLLIRSICIAIKNLQAQSYQRPWHTLIHSHTKSILKELYFEQIIAYYDVIKYNIKVNNRKAEKVDESYKSFKWGLIFFVISALLFVMHRSIYKIDDAQKVKIENQISIKQIENNINELNDKQIIGNSILDNINNQLLRKNHTNERN